MNKHIQFLKELQQELLTQENDYHYTSKAHTYAMMAWRPPKVERLLNILETFDWDAISTK
ncbi:hypothetical protein [Bacillus gaemokensis]|uniref:Uncharacterized protein n=1 Tax=Bacillus gaemokensis TaxID=574375 RepID=A0A073KAD0_9BACI|nr:hypothetical protein [Bacillus gaemokensis]KEK23505.1 hypothetical protein BAGA_08420 [Bacillus gaemokensis]KYG27126.1 hypothetical protein AZF08_15310 [Bacillus gaemokensis]